MFDDGPADDSIGATTSQGLNPNGAPCFLKKLLTGFGDS
jgi:hypothetical protein